MLESAFFNSSSVRVVSDLTTGTGSLLVLVGDSFEDFRDLLLRLESLLVLVGDSVKLGVNNVD